MEEKTEKIYEKVITLRTPIQLTKDGPIVETLKLHKPTAKQIVQLEAKARKTNEVTAISKLISDVTGVSLPVIEKLNISQWEEARDFLLKGE